MKYSFKDIILGAFSLNGSWLKFQMKMQTKNEKNNAKTLFGIENIPVDNHIRKILDKIDPKSFKKIYDDIVLFTFRYKLKY